MHTLVPSLRIFICDGENVHDDDGSALTADTNMYDNSTESSKSWKKIGSL